MWAIPVPISTSKDVICYLYNDNYSNNNNNNNNNNKKVIKSFIDNKANYKMLFTINFT